MLVRLGGLPATHASESPQAHVNTPGVCEAHTEAMALGIDTGTRAPSRPSARPVGEGVAGFACAPAAVAHQLAVDTVAVETVLRIPLPHPGPLASVTRTWPVQVGRMHGRSHPAVLCMTVARAGETSFARRLREGHVPPLPPIRASRRGAVPGVLFVTRRSRRDWVMLGKPRLARAWTRILADHRLPGGELSLVGVYGPLPLTAIDSMRLDPAGRLLVRLMRPRLRGEGGDVVLARHEPTGRLLRSDIPHDA